MAVSRRVESLSIHWDEVVFARTKNVSLEGAKISELEYWNNFYSNQLAHPDKILETERTFAKYVEEFFPFSKLIVDLGAGNGRDSKYFAQRNNKVLAIDGSIASISVIKNAKLSNLETLLLDLSPQESHEHLSSEINNLRISADFPVMIYCRFFLHSLEESAFKALIKNVQDFLVPGDIFATENRTTELSSYHFGTHFRRPFSNSEVLALIDPENFSITTNYESHGLSIYNGEDPKICRLLLERI